MDDNKKAFYRNQAEGIIKRLKSRKMDGYYCENCEEASRKILELIGDGRKTVSYGGSMTIDDMGVKSLIKEAGHDLIVREDYKTEDEIRELKAKTINSDTFLMSTNAITLDGKLINIDGRGNRVCYLIYGPEQVIVVAGMNKVVTNTEEGLDRVRNFASPPNTVRLHRDTPCARTGKCGHCIDDTICCQTVITRVSMIPGRIKVILIGEEAGY